MTTPRWDRALVIGAGCAGLFAAQVLSEFFQEVIVVERDLLGSHDGVRPGLPQAHHVHGMMARGAEILEELFPGVREELRAAGAPVFDFGDSFPVLLPSGWTPGHRVGIEAQSFDRATLDTNLCRRIQANHRITLLDGHDVRGLLLDIEHRRADGVLIREQGVLAETRLAADLVVDASGRSSRLPRWLGEAGARTPSSIEVDARYTYASRVYRIPAQAPSEWVCTLQMTYAPSVPRGGAVATVDGNRWVVSLMGAAGDLPPTGDAEFREYAAGLANPYVAQAASEGVPLSKVHRFTRLTNRWYRYDKLLAQPDRLIVIGDALCTFNPVYGQGMTVAGLEAVLLRALLRRGSLSGLCRSFQRQAAKQIRLPWLIATSSDLGWQTERPGTAARIARWYLARLIARIPGDPRLYGRFARVQHMLDSPAALAHPSVLWSVVKPPRPTPQSAHEGR